MSGLRLRTLVPLLAVVIFSVVVVMMARRAADAPSSSDTAVIESYTLLASRGQLLVGAYSRFQWHHPGPLYFYLLVPFYLASGEKTAGLYAGAAILALASVLVTAIVLLRRSPRLAVIVSAALAVFAWRASEAAASPWNPHVAVLPIVALVVVGADVIAGRFALLPLAALLASLAGQAHIAVIPCVLAIAAAAAIRVCIAAWRGNDRSRARRALAATGLVAAACWALPLYEQATASPRGNLALLWEFFVTRTAQGQPLTAALSAWADMLVGIVRPDFYPAHGLPFVESPVHWAEALSLIVVGIVALRGWIAARRHDPFAAALAALLLAASAIGLWSATRIEERIFDHDVFWLVGLGLLMLAFAVDTVIDGAGRSALSSETAAVKAHPHVTAIIVGALVAIAGAGSVSFVRGVVRTSFAPPAEARIAGQLADDLASYIAREGLRRPLVKIDQDAWPAAAGAILALQKRGQMTSVEEDWVVMFTPAFRVNGKEDAVVTVAAPAEHLRLRDAGVPEISSHEPVFAHATRTREP